MSLAHTETGETAEPSTDLATVDKSNAASVIGYLSQARDWLATCVEITGPAEIAHAKAQIATAAEATKQLHLSKEIQLDALEMVRRAEYALGKAIRKGQAEGTITKSVRETGGGPERRSLNMNSSSPRELIPHGQDRADIYGMTDGVEPAEFDAALDEAKSEGNLSRANVARKAKAKKQPGDIKGKSAEAIQARADRIEDMAGQGYSSRQIAASLDVHEATVKNTAKKFGIEIPADKVLGKTRRHDSTRIAAAVVADLESMYASIELIDYDDLNREQAGQWANSLDESFKVLNRFRKQIKELAQ
jgi:DNA-binding NarL/FixJ family response regulator